MGKRLVTHGVSRAYAVFSIYGRPNIFLYSESAGYSTEIEHDMECMWKWVHRNTGTHGNIGTLVYTETHFFIF